MCTTCGCAAGERRIEGDDRAHHHEHGHHHAHGHDYHHEHGHGHHHAHEHDHHHEHGHDHHHAHEHDHHHAHEHGHDHHHSHGHGHHHSHDHDGTLSRTVIIHHHYHHQGDVHHHVHTAIANKMGDVEFELEMENEAAEKPKETFAPREVENEQGGSSLDYGHGEAGTHAPGMDQKRMLQIEMDVLSKNNHLAEHNRAYFTEQHILALNLVSSPGSGKTTLLTETLTRLRDKVPCAVIEGDQQTTNDAERIRATGVPAIQVNTGKGCHLDAQMVQDAAARLSLQKDSVLFIENVGNLVCPASFDLGERAKVAVLSVTEGEDKPLKYPHMFAASKVMLLNKIDLLPYLSFDVDACIANARRVNPEILVIKVSATSGEGMDAWLSWLESQQCA
ncbi:hydrogenase nickel incorporation protein HypB [Leminorella grimontii]|uniref:hydrogenase nickel incorporation protein HypB n=1 Tax=Leminorella grimontii TaxID=82981 RepID=UPI0004869428|nr:hydrogenase nickel incorporation protein HypB [Leminorella grimontii]KFC92925.1 HypB family [NiFe] hydrogenase nickel incorporation-associated protein [Leminorella grimontii ATCC 33999 = DSM 5078]VFS62345.1 Hydrogenase isoenzymes nickel incorporation protein hypB [Leminorella grimontii]